MKLGSGNLSFHSLWYPIHAFLTTILLRHGQLHHVGDDHVFRCALYWPLYQATPRRRVRLSPVPESQVEDKSDETSHAVVARKR
jgi:hypothetical protein